MLYTCLCNFTYLLKKCIHVYINLLIFIPIYTYSIYIDVNVYAHINMHCMEALLPIYESKPKASCCSYTPKRGPRKTNKFFLKGRGVPVLAGCASSAFSDPSQGRNFCIILFVSSRDPTPAR